ncbi:DUF2147 domain-containing protein [Paraburkholderia humisilvae]|uniref:DUF2147 domain-containing protein n=1 Tax=Paraburkholderia humisilvae TaxID=627669 RepID=A0A6J5F5P3_9BURK|nr:DUF2147 domain-containing protein [Paraburkholderia humisilvae]CAB3773673.1 hypothetical protein LMG29542_07378 [Paraburkholderia humisilvae]
MMQFSRRAGGFAGRALREATVASMVLISSTAAFAQSDSPVGTWQTIDDHTHQPKALVQITQDENGVLSGKVIKSLNPNEPPGRRCTECTDARKDQLILGMTIIDDMKKDGDVWDGGQILDPENGKLYKCKMHTEDGGQKLVVRGYIGVSLLGRSQTWIRQN